MQKLQGSTDNQRLRRLMLVGLIAYALVLSLYVLSQNYQKIKVKLTTKNQKIMPVDPAVRDPKFNIILNAVPKSASAYIASTLEKSLDYEHAPISSEYIPQDQLIYFRLAEFYERGSRLSKQHFDASPLNLRVIKRFTNKIVLNLRDPREILLSWVHHLNALKAEGNEVYYVDPLPPPEYYSLSLSEQIDWNIENFLPTIVKWMNDWVVAKQREDASENGLQILVTTYDELKQDELGLYKKIMAFYGINQDRLRFEPAAKDRSTHYRKADSNEWRNVFTQQQKERIAQIVPDDLLERFGWKK